MLADELAGDNSNNTGGSGAHHADDTEGGAPVDNRVQHADAGAPAVGSGSGSGSGSHPCSSSSACDAPTTVTTAASSSNEIEGFRTPPTRPRRGGCVAVGGGDEMVASWAEGLGGSHSSLARTPRASVHASMCGGGSVSPPESHAQLCSPVGEFLVENYFDSVPPPRSSTSSTAVVAAAAAAAASADVENDSFPQHPPPQPSAPPPCNNNSSNNNNNNNANGADPGDPNAVTPRGGTASAKPTHAGWLEKRGDGLIRLYKRRWCEVHGEYLYYHSGPGEECLGKVNLSGGTNVSVREDGDGGGKRRHVFELSGNDLPRTYALAADTEEERNGWVRAISKTIKWCEVASAEVIDDWLEALLPESTSLQLSDFKLGGVIGRGSFAKVVRVTLLREHRPPPPAPERRKWLRDNLNAFYRTYKPERLRGVDTLVKYSHPGHEQKLYQRLLERYPSAEADLRWLLDPPKNVVAAVEKAQNAARREEKDARQPREFALKVVKKSSLPSIKVARMMMAEKAILQSMNHPNIVKLHFAFQTSTKLYLVLSYLGGGDLRTHLTRDKRFSEPRARFYCAQILLALDHLHLHGIVYRDLKPQNVVIDSDGHAVLTDLGLARDITESGRAYTFCGTPQYLAPEVLQGQGYKKAVDFWALGVVTYEMLVGATPFQAGDSMHEMFLRIMDENVKYPALIGRHARDFLSQVLERDPAKRLCSLSVARSGKFFKPISWSDLKARKAKPPYKPPCESPAASPSARDDVAAVDWACFDDAEAPGGTGHNARGAGGGGGGGNGSSGGGNLFVKRGRDEDLHNSTRSLTQTLRPKSFINDEFQGFSYIGGDGDRPLFNNGGGGGGGGSAVRGDEKWGQKGQALPEGGCDVDFSSMFQFSPSGPLDVYGEEAVDSYS